MIKVDNIDVMNFKAALRGMRNPLESWAQSDSAFYCDDSLADYRCEYREGCAVELREKDLTLCQKLINSGHDSHSKFMRQIFVSMDITAPIYWWKEMDQYRIGCTTNSESTMHKLATTPITCNCFSFDNMDEISPLSTDFFEDTVDNCERLRKYYLETKDVRYWRALIQLLPSGWNQKRTWTANYAVLRNIYFSRRNHKLTEWAEFCKVIEKLPYAKELICYEKEIK